MTREEIMSHVDHTVLAQTATPESIRALCDDAIYYHTASVCIPPCYVKMASEYLKGRIPVCTVIGFPNGNTTAACKVFETKEAIANGASEVDMVINVGALKAGDDAYVLNEMKEVRKASEGKILKVIIECCLLTDEEKVKMCRLVTEAGADFIKTSTGFSTGGATFEDVKLMAENVGEGVRVKAAGGIHSFADAEKFLQLGASRLGTSRLVKIAKAEDGR